MTLFLPSGSSSARSSDRNQISYYTYYDCKFKLIMKQLQLDHKPHDCHHTFATLMDNAVANNVALKRIVGHASTGITDKVYTKKDVGELLKGIDLILCKNTALYVS